MNPEMPSRNQGIAAWVAAFLLLLLVGVPPALAGRGAYEAELPANLTEARDLCALVPCTDVFPGAARFSERMGQPPYVEAYGPAQGGKAPLLGYVMLSTDITDIPAYSGKPVVTLIGMDRQGRYVGVKVLKHSEPILLLGIPESALLNFNKQYIGKSVKDKIEVGQSRADEGVLGVDAISGATVTVIAQNQVLTTATAAVARQVGILSPTRHAPTRYAQTGQRASWADLVKLGSVQRLLIRPEQLGLERAPEPFIELWFGDLNHPDLGASLLGQSAWNDLHARLKPDEHAIFVIRTAGAASFKGSGFVRGGIYDRIQIKQDAASFTFRDSDYLNLYGLAADGAPAYTESAIFVVRSPGFSAAYPWKLSLLGNRVDRATGTRSFVTFDAPYWLPDALLQGGRPHVDAPEAPWRRVWRTRAPQIALFVALLVAVGVVYALRERLTRRATHKNKWPVNAFKYSAWALSIGFVGFGAMAQPSITQVLTWFHSLLFQWTWSLFLTDPFIFCFWIFIILTVFLFGRGLFCGWLCPFGSLSEAIHKIGGRIGFKRWQRQLPRAWHDRLEVAEVRPLLRPADGLGVLDGAGRKARRGGAVQDHVPGRHPPSGVAVRIVRLRAAGDIAVCRAAVLQVPLPPRGGAGHAEHVPLVRPAPQAGLQQLQGVRRGLRLAGDRRGWPHRPSRMPALPGLHGAVHRRQGLPAAGPGSASGASATAWRSHPSARMATSSRSSRCPCPRAWHRGRTRACRPSAWCRLDRRGHAACAG